MAQSQMHCLRPKARNVRPPAPAFVPNADAPSVPLSAKMKYRTTDHSVYNLNYHIVLVTKYRNKVLSGAIEEYLKEQVYDICDRYRLGTILTALVCQRRLRKNESGFIRPDNTHVVGTRQVFSRSFL